MRRQQFRIVVISSIVFFSLYAFSGSESRMQKPVALDKIRLGDLFALDFSGAVFRINISSTGMKVVSSFDLPSLVYPVDMVSAKLFGEPTLLVSLYRNGWGGVVSQYSLDGKLQHTWQFKNGAAGLDVDVNSHVIYVASLSTDEVFQINLQPSGETAPVFTGGVLGARHLGPLVADLGRHRLLVADSETGRLFEFRLFSRIRG